MVTTYIRKLPTLRHNHYHRKIIIKTNSMHSLNIGLLLKPKHIGLWNL